MKTTMSRKKKAKSHGQLQGSGLMGYISSQAPQPSEGYGAGIGFYVAVYPILPEPIDHFQIGLASTWIIPDNLDNTTVPLCPPAPTPGIIGRNAWTLFLALANFKGPLAFVIPESWSKISADYTFGLQWNRSPVSPNGEFPRYFKNIGQERVAVAASEVPDELRAKEFKPAANKKKPGSASFVCNNTKRSWL